MSRAKDLTPAELETLFNDYFKEITSKPRYQKIASYGKLMDLELDRPPTLLGFYRYGSKRGYSLNHYFNNSNEAYNEYFVLCNTIKNTIHSELLEMALLGLIKENLASKLLGYTNEELKLNLVSKDKNQIDKIVVEIVAPTE
jgi:hypothetical protein